MQNIATGPCAFQEPGVAEEACWPRRAVHVMISGMRDAEQIIVGKGRVSEDDGSFDRYFWSCATPEERMAAMFDLREIYLEVMHPGSGAERLDRTVVGTRKLRD